MTRFNDLLNTLKKTEVEIQPEDLNLNRTSSVVLDVREGEEFRAGHIPGAVHLSRGFLEIRAETVLPDKSAKIAVYCAGGTRSLLACQSLKQLGYKNVCSLAGGFNGWKKREFEVETPKALSDWELKRYARHLVIPEVGEKGQLKLLDSKVLLVGAGGLGSPAALYLAASGVGTLGLVDFDTVDESNLQRQILHTTDRVGTSKLASAEKTLKAFNPKLNTKLFEERLDKSNVEGIFNGFDLVLDGSDNFPTRYLVNDACVKLKKPCIHGSVYRFEGQVSVFDTTNKGPCYRCLYPEPPPAEMAPSCVEAGVLGVLPGVIGLLQAVEAIKLLLDIGTPLIGRLLTYDALGPEIRILKNSRDKNCLYCGEGKPFPGYADYQNFCANNS